MNATLAIEILIVALLLIGGVFSLIGSFGLFKLSDFYKRLHGPTKATTLGVGGVLLASLLHHSLLGEGLSLRELLITLFLFMTAPVSAYLMAKAALRTDGSAPPVPTARSDAPVAPEADQG